jgi:hypothetical protein
MRGGRKKRSRNLYRVLVEKPEGNRPLGRPWKNNSIMGLRETGWDGMDWIFLAQDRSQWRVPVNRVTNLHAP